MLLSTFCLFDFDLKLFCVCSCFDDFGVEFAGLVFEWTCLVFLLALFGGRCCCVGGWFDFGFNVLCDCNSRVSIFVILVCCYY